MNEFINFVTGVTIWSVMKILVLIALAIYTFFSIVVVRQVKMMTKVVSADFDFPIKIISWIHFFLSILVIFLAFVIL
jgi:uncharacterized protein with PQ loop repeat